MATALLSTNSRSLSIQVPTSRAPAQLPTNVFSIGQARVQRETPTYLRGRL